MAYNLQEQTRAHARPNRFHQRQKTRERDGWRAIIVQRAIRYSVWRVEEFIHIYARRRTRWSKDEDVEGGGKRERAWYTFNTVPEEPPAQQVHRRWFSSSFLLAALRLPLTVGPAPCVRDLPQCMVDYSFFFFFYAERNRSEAFSPRPKRKDRSVIVAPNAPACLMILMIIDLSSIEF